jgi:hypothetical protein
VPSNAYLFGHDGAGGPALYACRAYVDDKGFQLGKIRQGFGGCHIGYAWQELTATSYQVLVATMPMDIKALYNVTPPSNALIGGYDFNGQPLYLCNAFYGGGQVPGKVGAAFTTCYVAYGGTEHSVAAYNVLVPKETANGPSATPYIAGYDSDGSALGVCTTALGVGKYRNNVGTCNFGYQGAEYTYNTNFQVIQR